MSEISVQAITIFHIGPIPINNAELAAFLLTLFFVVFAVLIRRRMGIVPGRIQAGIEVVADYLLSQLENAFGSEKEARRFFPLMMTVLLFLLVANQFSIIPLVTQVVIDASPVFRAPTTHLSLALALAVFMVLLSNVLAFSVSPLKHLGNFITIKPLLRARSVSQLARGILDFFLGFLNIISELAKVFSLSFRLFGNVFAGEVMVAVIAGLSAFTHFLVPMPFVALSIFSGLIQAFVFTLLSTQYIASSIRTVREV